VNGRDEDGNTPLHVAADPKSVSADLVKMLLKCGAHLDETNNAKETFESLSKDKIHSFLDPMPYTTLKCLAARVVSNAGLPFSQPGSVPEQLKPFIHNH
jgi:hypothetical protein